MSAWFYILLLLSVFSLWLFVRRADPMYRMPVAVLLGSYGITTVLGATVISMLPSLLIFKVVVGDLFLDTRFLTDLNSFLYWFLLYSPFIVVPLIVTAVGKKPRRGGLLTRAVAICETDVDVVSYTIVLVAFVGVCMFLLVRAGFGGNLLRAAELSGHQTFLIRLRTQIFASFPAGFFGIIYVLIPTLCAVALYQFLVKRKLVWLLLLAAAVLSDVVLILSTIQKGVMLVMLLGLSLGYASLRGVRLWTVLLSVVSGFGLLTILQLAMAGKWTAYRSLLLVIFRMADCFPYYVSVYPRLLPFQGLPFDLGLLGMGLAANDNVKIYNYMYPTLGFFQGNATAAAHVRGYTQGGILATLLFLVIIALLVIFVGKLRQAVRGPLTFAFYVQGLIMLYCLTQTSLRGAIVESNGIIYAVEGLAALWVVRTVVVLAASTSREQARAVLAAQPASFRPQGPVKGGA